jgi:gluconate 2-dehydrogenase gamma chain
MSDDGSKKITRRELLRSAGMAGAAAVLSPSLVTGTPSRDAESVAEREARSLPMVGRPRRLQNLTVEETEILDAMIARLIPADELGPGAREAGAIQYIDRELGGALAGSREAYRTGLAALDLYARYSRGARFAELSPIDQDSLLIDVQSGSATGAGTGFAGSSGAFFNMVRSHTWQGTFSDPQYGGNQRFVGWDLIRYPGVRRVVSARDQEMMEAGDLAPNHLSAYDR